MLRYAVCHAATEARLTENNMYYCLMGHRSLLTVLLQCHSGCNHFHAKLQGCKTHLKPTCKDCEFVIWKPCCSGQCIHTWDRERNTEHAEREPRWGKASSVNFTHTAAKGHWSNCWKVPELLLRGKREVGDTSKKSIWHMTVARNLQSAKSVTHSKCRGLCADARHTGTEESLKW